MKRFKVLFGQRRFQALITIAAIMLAASVVVASGANFTSTSANPSNVFTAGNLKHSNTKDGAAILTADKMKPGDTRTGSVTLTNDGDISGAFSFTKTMGANVLGLGSGDFRTKLDLTIKEGATTIWTGKIGAAIPALNMDLGTWAPGATHTYDFTVTFPDGGSGGADNAYKSAGVTVAFDWTAVQ
jgi:spore coat-associated protein N